VPVNYRYADLEGKVAVVTGASQHLGAAMATALGEQGCKVAVVGRSNREGAEAVARQIVEGGSQTIALCADLTQPDQVTATFDQIVAELGPVEILVNNAGGWRRSLPFMEMGLEEWRETLSNNLDSMFLCTQAVVPGMVERRWGRIINLASIYSRIAGKVPATHYGTAKGGVLSFTRHLAMELGPHGITVNGIAPGTTPKPGGGKRGPAFYAELAANLPSRRVGVAEDHAAAICFLASESASWVTGVTIDVSGGQVMS
jgi:3-oxoacyl-[acyl-carrier protein] reductase